eukprot:TRINITY_DN23907_c0_g1_i2.p1 TRINITY_DN23907_c0_g1~~TRINITY_DN23907_c0_g1_i2.p1  ORF type:complete len:446 (+),score=90.95 TRINITY_DN23907_c0_g1_i2:78-1340(+)
MWRRARAAVATGGGLAAAASGQASAAPRPWSLSDMERVYYQSYGGAGIGERVGVDDSGATPLSVLPCVERVTSMGATRGELRRWAADPANWQLALERHKGAYFTRKTNGDQEALLDTVRSHYASAAAATEDHQIGAVLYRVRDFTAAQELAGRTQVTRVPPLVSGVFDEQRENCVVDFANKRLGGGWMSYGMVQEEKMVTERFDYSALFAKALTDMPDPRQPGGKLLACAYSLQPHEAWLLTGGQRWAQLDWYGWTPRDWLRRSRLLDPQKPGADASAPAVVAVDAIKSAFERYETEHLSALLLKAFVGFAAARDAAPREPGGVVRVATGNWACGAFYGNKNVMYVVQALAAEMAGVELAYYLPEWKREPVSPVQLGIEFVESCAKQRLTVAEALQQLGAQCAAAKSRDTWMTSWKPSRM